MSLPIGISGKSLDILTSLLIPSNRGIVSYVSQFKVEATAAHNAGKKFFLGETNSGASFLTTADLHLVVCTMY